MSMHRPTLRMPLIWIHVIPFFAPVCIHSFVVLVGWKLESTLEQWDKKLFISFFNHLIGCKVLELDSATFCIKPIPKWFLDCIDTILEKLKKHQIMPATVTVSARTRRRNILFCPGNTSIDKSGFRSRGQFHKQAENVRNLFARMQNSMLLTAGSLFAISDVLCGDAYRLCCRAQLAARIFPAATVSTLSNRWKRMRCSA